MKKLHQALFFLLLTLLPVQLGRHFWPDFSLIFGIRVDYLSPTVYLTDLLVIGILISWLWEIRNQFSVKKNWWIIAVFCFLLANALFAQNQGAALYELVKIIEFSLLGLYVAKNRFQLSLLHFPLSIAIAYSSLLALAQFIFQRSLGGLFWWLGERTFNAFTPGIARAVWDGQLIMRPYATFPHPNVLAGFILVVMILLLGNFKSTNLKFEIGQLDDWLIRAYWLLVFILGLITLFISFSRSVWIVGILVYFWLVIRYLKTSRPNKKIFYFVFCPPAKALATAGALLFVLGAFFYSILHLSTEEAISRRLQLNNAAIEMIQENPLVGVGLNNFIPRLPDYWQTSEAVRFLQPVHNIFLLIAAEIGLIGLLIFLWFLILTFKKLLEIVPRSGIPPGGRNWKLVIPLLVILLLGVVDHYWLTLQQTQLLFTLILGMSWAKH